MHFLHRVVRTLLNNWKERTRSMKVDITVQQMSEISQVLVHSEKLRTEIFIGKTITIDGFSRLASSSLYFTSCSLNRILDIVHQRFLLLDVAIRILSCKVSVENSSYTDYA